MNHRPSQRRGTSAASPARIEPLEPRRLLAAMIEPPIQFLGEVGTGYHQQIVRNVPARRTDSWGFNVTKPVAVTLLADRLKHDGDLILQRVNSRGQTRTLAKSSSPGRAAERIELTLEPGRYNVILANQANKTNSYRLTTRTAEVAAPTNVVATPWGGNAVHVRWYDNSHNETGFRVQQWIRGRWKNVAEAGRNETAAVVEGHIKPGDQPHLRVVAIRRTASIASVNTQFVSLSSQDTSGWYKVKSVTYRGKGEAGWAAITNTQQPGHLYIKPDHVDQWTWAGSWQQAVRNAVTGTFRAEVTYALGGYNVGDVVSHTYSTAGAFMTDTADAIHAVGLASRRGASAIPDDPDMKIISVEDTWGYDEDFDDFYWEVKTEFTQLSIEAVEPQTAEGGQTKGKFRITRTGDKASSMQVPMTLGGDAEFQADYTLSLGSFGQSGPVRGTLTLPGGSEQVDIEVTAIEDGSNNESEEIVTLTIEHQNASANVQLLDRKKLLLATYGAGPIGENTANFIFEHLVSRIATEHEQNLLLDVESQMFYNERQLRGFFGRIDSDSDKVISAAEAESVDVDLIGYSWGAINAHNYAIFFNRTGEEIAGTGYSLDKAIQVGKLVEIDPVPTINKHRHGPVPDNVAAAITYYQRRGADSTILLGRLVDGEFSVLRDENGDPLYETWGGANAWLRGSDTDGATNIRVDTDWAERWVTRPYRIPGDLFYNTTIESWGKTRGNEVNHGTIVWYVWDDVLAFFG